MVAASDAMESMTMLNTLSELLNNALKIKRQDRKNFNVSVIKLDYDPQDLKNTPKVTPQQSLALRHSLVIERNKNQNSGNSGSEFSFPEEEQRCLLAVYTDSQQQRRYKIGQDYVEGYDNNKQRCLFFTHPDIEKIQVLLEGAALNGYQQKSAVVIKLQLTALNDNQLYRGISQLMAYIAMSNEISLNKAETGINRETPELPQVLFRLLEPTLSITGFTHSTVATTAKDSPQVQFTLSAELEMLLYINKNIESTQTIKEFHIQEEKF